MKIKTSVLRKIIREVIKDTIIWQHDSAVGLDANGDGNFRVKILIRKPKGGVRKHELDQRDFNTRMKPNAVYVDYRPKSDSVLVYNVLLVEAAGTNPGVEGLDETEFNNETHEVVIDAVSGDVKQIKLIDSKSFVKTQHDYDEEFGSSFGY